MDRDKKDSLPDGSAVRSQIQDIIPNVYSTTLATGIDRQVTTIPDLSLLPGLLFLFLLVQKELVINGKGNLLKTR